MRLKSFYRTELEFDLEETSAPLFNVPRGYGDTPLFHW